MAKYYQPEIETAPREKILEIQNEKLVKQIHHVWDNVPYYRHLMEEKGLTPDDIKTVDDIHKLPFLSKADLRETYPYGLLGTDLKNCVRIHSTSGTTGKRVVAFYTQHDIDLWEDCCARAIVAAGGTNEDVCQISYGYGLFTGGPGLNGGSHKVGCLTVPTIFRAEHVTMPVRINGRVPEDKKAMISRLQETMDTNGEERLQMYRSSVYSL